MIEKFDKFIAMNEGKSADIDSKKRFDCWCT